MSSITEARVVRLRIERREVILDGRAFGAAGPYEKLVGKVDFGLDPSLPRNGDIVDLKLAPRNARGEVEASADFYMLKPVDPRRGNGRLFYEVGNRGGKAMLRRFRRRPDRPIRRRRPSSATARSCARGSRCSGWDGSGTCPSAPARCGWRCRSRPRTAGAITGVVRGNFILNERAKTASVADRAHKAYPALDPDSAENVMTVRDDPTAKGQVIPRAHWHFVDAGTVALDGGFEPGRIYDVVYRSADPRVIGVGLSGARDLDQLFEVRHIRREPDAWTSLRDRLGRVAERPLSAPLPLSGIQRGRAGTQGVRRRLRSGRRRRTRIVQPPLRPGVARRAAVSSTSSFRSICFRSPTVRRPIRRAARSTACSRAPSAPAPRRRSFTC